MVKTQGLSIGQVCKDMNWEATLRCAAGKPLTAEHQRIRHLKIENGQLREDVEILKNVGLLYPGTPMSFALIGSLKKQSIAVS